MCSAINQFYVYNLLKLQNYHFETVEDEFERIGRKLVCECEMLRDDKKRRRMELEKMFGVDFGEPGKRGMGLV
jgi:hypothetical protein